MQGQTTPEVKTATRSEESKVIDPIVMAFSADPVIRWFYPDSSDYLLHAPEFVRLYAGRGFDHESAHYVEGSSAGALWHPPGVESDGDAIVRHVGRSMSERRGAALRAVAEQLDEYHPEEPYWTLRLIGVDPMQQRKGNGTSLLRHGLERCDEEQTHVYLESSNPLNVPLYVRHGFEILGTVTADSMPPLIPMCRPPRE